MLKRIEEHLEFHKAIDTHKSDVVFLEELKAYVLNQQNELSTVQSRFVKADNDHAIEQLKNRELEQKVEELQDEVSQLERTEDRPWGNRIEGEM